MELGLCLGPLISTHHLPDSGTGFSVAAGTNRQKAEASNTAQYQRAPLCFANVSQVSLGANEDLAGPRSFIEGDVTEGCVPLPFTAAGGHPRLGLLPPFPTFRGGHGPPRAPPSPLSCFRLPFLGML